MFWGLIMEPEKRYSQIVKRSFHISMAALVPNTSDNQPTQVMCGMEDRNYLLCTLQKDKILQVPLDLNFEKGDEISFAVNGNSHVHLTGYLNDDVLEDMEEEEEDEEVEEEQAEQEVSKKKRKAANNGEPRKKLKTEILLDELEDEEDEDDSDFDALQDEDDDDENIEGEEDGDDMDEEDEDEDEEDEDEEDEKPTVSSKLNGMPKMKKQEQKTEKPGKKKGDKNKENKAENQEKSDKKTGVQKKTVEGGVTIEDIKVGNGQIAKPGKSVQVYYEGRFQKSNKVFDSATKGNGFKFRLGKQEVIKGWDVGIQGMKVGGKRRITCPPNMAYGSKGSPPVIPPNSTLVFEVELKNVH